MKQITTIFGLGVVGVMLILYFDNRQTISTGTTQAIEAAVLFWQYLLWSILGIIILAAIVAAYIGISIYRQRVDMYTRDRQRDGAYSLREYRIRRPWYNPFGGVTVLVDPNMMESGAALIGDHGYHEAAPARESVRIEVQRTRHLQAMTPGDAAISSPNGSMYRPGGRSMNEATRKMLSGSPAPTSPRIEHRTAEEDAPVTPVTMYPAGNLQARNTESAIVLGQSPEDGSMATWNVVEQPHIRLHGSSQGGKSSLARYIALSALVQGWRVVILDRRRFKDWKVLEGYAELCDVSQPQALAAHLAHLHTEYRERDRLLGAHGAPNIAALPDRQRPARTLVVVEEFGVALVNAKAEGVADQVLNALRPIAQEAGAAGIHLMMVDQLPVDWDRAVKANVGAVVTFRQPENSGQAAGYWAAHQLRPYHFAMDGVEYKAPYIAPDRMAEGLRNMGVTPPPVLMEDVTVRPSAHPHTPPSTSGSGQPDTLADTDTDTTTDAQQRIINYYAANPDAGVREAARVLGLSKTYVSDVRREMVSGPPRVDAFGRQQTVIDAEDPANADVLAEIRQAIEAGQVNVNKRK